MIISEFDEGKLALKKTVSQIDTRQPGEGERLHLSGFGSSKPATLIN